jgi:hypothetical protein
MNAVRAQLGAIAARRGRTDAELTNRREEARGRSRVTLRYRTTRGIIEHDWAVDDWDDLPNAIESDMELAE